MVQQIATCTNVVTCNSDNGQIIGKLAVYSRWFHVLLLRSQFKYCIFVVILFSHFEFCFSGYMKRLHSHNALGYIQWLCGLSELWCRPQIEIIFWPMLSYQHFMFALYPLMLNNSEVIGNIFFLGFRRGVRDVYPQCTTDIYIIATTLKKIAVTFLYVQNSEKNSKKYNV